MNKKIILIGVGVGVVLCLCVAVIVLAAGAAGILGVTQPTADAGEKFMQALKAADYEAANALMTPELQKKIGGHQGLKKMIESNRARPTQLTFTERSVNGDQGHLEGNVTMVAGEGTVSLDLVKSGDAWLVIGFNLKPK